MPLTYDTCSAVILAGGNSKRMGCCKALLPLENKSMLAHILEQLSDFEDVLISTNTPSLAETLPARQVPDIFSGAGPLAGLHAALRAARNPALLCVPCDLPNFSAQLAEFLLNRFSAEIYAVICRDSAGKIHPLCGIYSKHCLPLLENQLGKGERRVQTFLRRIPHICVDIAPFFPDSALININTPENWEMFRASQQKIWRSADAAECPTGCRE